MQRGDADSWFVLAFCKRNFEFGSDMLMIALDRFFEESGIPDELREPISIWLGHSSTCNCSVCRSISNEVSWRRSQNFIIGTHPHTVSAADYIVMIDNLAFSGFVDATGAHLVNRYIKANHPHLYKLVHN